MNATQVFLNFCSAKATIAGFALTYGEWLDLYEVENGLYWPTSTRSKSHAHFEAKRAAESNVIASFPAYDIVKPVVNAAGYIVATAEQQFALKTDRERTCWMRHYSISSVVSYAMKNGDCPIESVERAQRLGHELHWLNGIGAMLTAHQRAKETYIAIERGALIQFEGRIFEVIAQPNDNLGLKFVKTAR
jgi:hypothetical protein